MFTNKNKINTRQLDEFDWRQHLTYLDEKKRQRQLREMKNRQQEIQNEFFELEKAMIKLNLEEQREEQRRKDNIFRRCGALVKKGKLFVVCCNKLNKSKGYENVKFCGKHQNRTVVHILNDWRGHGQEEYWRGRLI